MGLQYELGDMWYNRSRNLYDFVQLMTVVEVLNNGKKFDTSDFDYSGAEVAEDGNRVFGRLRRDLKSQGFLASLWNRQSPDHWNRIKKELTGRDDRLRHFAETYKDHDCTRLVMHLLKKLKLEAA